MANIFRPNVTLLENRVEIGRKLAFRSMFTVSDLDQGSVVTKYRFRDNNSANYSGFFTVAGVRQVAGAWIEVHASQVHTVRYNAGLIVDSESVSVQVFDGLFYSNVRSGQVDTIIANTQRPTLTTTNGSVLSSETTQLGPLMTYSDPEGAPVAFYSVIDRSTRPDGGFFTLNGVRQTSGQFFTFAAARLGQLRYVGGSSAIGENIGVRASDGRFFSTTADIRITTLANRFAPEANANSLRTGLNRRIPFQNMIRFTDADGNSLKKFEFFDSGEAGGGYISINGFRQPEGQRIIVNANQLENTYYNSPATSALEDIEIRVFDGKFWSDVSVSTISTFNRPTLVSDSNDVSIDELEQVFVSDFVSQGDNGFRFTKYEVFDENDFFRSAELFVGNQVLQQGQIHELTSAQFEDLRVEGAVNDFGRSLDSIIVRGFNGRFYSDWQRINVNTDPTGADALVRVGPPEDPWFALINPDTGVYEIPFSFVESLQGGDSFPFHDPDDTITPFDNAMKEDYRQVLANLERFVNIEFKEVAYTKEADDHTMTIGRRAIDGPGGILAFAVVPEVGDGFANPFGDNWYDTADFPFNGTPVGKNSVFRTVVMHELGHALSFKHPFSGVPQLPTNSQFSYNTVMTNYPGSDPAFHPEAPSNYMLYDIVRFQEEFGANPNYNTGNDHYFWGRGDTALQAVHDSGGIDTLNMGNQIIGGGIIDIRQGQRSALNGQNNSVLVPYGVEIENARGTRSADTIIGTETKNLLFGNEGMDTLIGRGGNDVLRGGTQSDTYQFTVGDGRDQVREEQQGGLDVIEYRDPTGRLDSLRDDFSFRRLGRDLRIDFTLDQGGANHTAMVRDMQWGRSRVEVLRLFGSDGEQLGQDIELNSIFLQADSKATRFKVTQDFGTYGFLAIPV